MTTLEDTAAGSTVDSHQMKSLYDQPDGEASNSQFVPIARQLNVWQGEEAQHLLHEKPEDEPEPGAFVGRASSSARGPHRFLPRWAKNWVFIAAIATTLVVGAVVVLAFARSSPGDVDWSKCDDKGWDTSGFQCAFLESVDFHSAAMNV